MDVRTDDPAPTELDEEISSGETGPPGRGEPDGAGDMTPGDGPPGLSQRSNRIWAWVALATASVSAVALARYTGVVGKGGLNEVARAGAATVAVFGIVGFGPTRLLLPPGLRRFELLWVLPVGAVATALELTLLTYAHVPFDAALPIVLLAGVALAGFGWRRDPGLPTARSAPAAGLDGLDAASWRTLLVPLYIALLIAMVALLPMFRAGFATVIGNGSDAHLAVGTGMFLQENRAGTVNIDAPVDHVPLVWNSKPPIYLAFGAVAKVAGMEPYAVIATMAGVLLALAALGFWLLARELLGAGAWAAGAAMALIGLNRMALFTTMHPYFNQIWAFMAMPFAIVLAWHVVRRGTFGGWIMLGSFLALLGFAYPLALPVPLMSIVVFIAFERRRRGLRLIWLPRLRSRKDLIWIVPLALLLLSGPVKGVFEKAGSVLSLLNYGGSLANWGGDLPGFIPERYFLGLGDSGGAAIALGLLLVGLVIGLRHAPRDVRWGLGIVLVFGVLAALFFRPREYGWYFHFKALAFVAPIGIAIAAVGLARFRHAWVSAIALILVIGAARTSAADEIGQTFDQLPKSLLELRSVDARLPPDASVRLDIPADGRMLWAGILLGGQPLCSQKPVMETSYPHVPVSRAADYVLVDDDWRKPFDAVGDPVMTLDRYRLFRLEPGLAGGDRCSREMVQNVESLQ
ncbi:MAG TPA: hypothetical protein VNA28_05485 [Solirubrobacteraceae bacterium]|nr:hypothetical protein [Solirubrobacteraceae bacterium]